MSRARCIAWISTPLIPWLGEVQLDGELRATRNERGLFLEGELPRHHLRTLVPARLFYRSAPGTWTEAGTYQIGVGPPENPDFRKGCDALLQTHSGERFRLKDPSVWPLWNRTKIDRARDPESRDAKDAEDDKNDLATSSSWQLRLVRHPRKRRSPLDGIICTPGAGTALAEYLSEQPSMHLRDLRRGEARGFWWLYSPKGIDPDLPRVGRSLVNSGSPLAPVLIPAGRRPSPWLEANQIRTAFKVPEGDGLLWWDSARGEEHCIFRRADLIALNHRVLRDSLW